MAVLHCVPSPLRADLHPPPARRRADGGGERTRRHRRVFSLGPEEFDIGSNNADLLEPFVGSRSVLGMDGAEHRDERRRLQHAFRAERLETYAELVRAITLADLAGWPRGRPFPIHERTRAITLEVILRAVFGAKGEAELAGLRSALGDFLRDSSGSPLVLAPAFRRQLGGHSPWARFVRQRAAVHENIRALFARRRSSTEEDEGTDMRSALLAAGSDGDVLLGSKALEQPRRRAVTMMQAHGCLVELHA